jgi:ferredoxin-nitrite reductase
MARAAEKDLIDESSARRSYLGVHAQKQQGLSWVGVCVPGRGLHSFTSELDMSNSRTPS